MGVRNVYTLLGFPIRGCRIGPHGPFRHRRRGDASHAAGHRVSLLGENAIYRLSKRKRLATPEKDYVWFPLVPETHAVTVH